MKEHFLCGAQGLAIGYGKTPLLSDICLGVQPGQILTLIGPNGAGKSRCCWKAEALPITPVPSGRRSWPSWLPTAAGWS